MYLEGLQHCEEKISKRRAVLAKHKEIEERLRSAFTVKDHLTSFPAFSHYDRNGLSVYFESGFGDRLSSLTKKYIQNLLKVNMKGQYGSDWPIAEKMKRREMVAQEARYIFVRESLDMVLCDNSPKENDSRTGDGGRLVGFVHYRFDVEQMIPVVYVYELQLESCARGKGLGKFLMQLVELIAQKNQMGAVMLTAQKMNTLAVNFYTNSLRYVISSISPSKMDPLTGAEHSYEILCKSFHEEAKAKLETHPEVKHSKDKIIINWSDLGVLCGTDKATGSQAGIATETVNEIDAESVAEESFSTHTRSRVDAERSSGMRRKRARGRNDAVAAAIVRLVESLKDNFGTQPSSSSSLRSSSNVDGIYAKLALMTDLDKDELYTAMEILSYDAVKHDIFITLPDNLKADWVRRLLGR